MSVLSPPQLLYPGVAVRPTPPNPSKCGLAPLSRALGYRGRMGCKSTHTGSRMRWFQDNCNPILYFCVAIQSAAIHTTSVTLHFTLSK